MAEIVLTKEQAREFGVAVAKVIDGHDPDVLYEWYAKFNGPMWESLEEIKERMPATRRAVVAAHDRGDSVQAPKPLVYCARKRSDMTPCVITDGDCARDDSGECVGCGRKNVIAGVSDPDDYPAATLDPPTRLVPVDPTIPPEYGQQYRLCQVEDCESDEETGESRATVCGRCHERALDPPTLKVGDSVLYRGSKTPGVLRHIDEPRGEVRWADGYLSSPKLSDLRRVEEDTP